MSLLGGGDGGGGLGGGGEGGGGLGGGGEGGGGFGGGEPKQKDGLEFNSLFQSAPNSF